MREPRHATGDFETKGRRNALRQYMWCPASKSKTEFELSPPKAAAASGRVTGRHINPWFPHIKTERPACDVSHAVFRYCPKKTRRVPTRRGHTWPTVQTVYIYAWVHGPMR